MIAIAAGYGIAAPLIGVAGGDTAPDRPDHHRDLHFRRRLRHGDRRLRRRGGGCPEGAGRELAAKQASVNSFDQEFGALGAEMIGVRVKDGVVRMRDACASRGAKDFVREDDVH